MNEPRVGIEDEQREFADYGKVAGNNRLTSIEGNEKERFNVFWDI